MIFPRKLSLLTLIIIILLTISSNAQIVFHELPGYKMNIADSIFFEINQFRKIIPLNGAWQVYKASDPDKKKITVNIPSVFEGTGELVFERNFSLSQFDLEDHQLSLVFLGVNYSADISVNGKIIYTHTGGEYPFSFDLPRDILNTDRDNILTVKVKYQLDSENTIPLKQRFLFPKDFGGIFRDVFIKSRPNISFSNFSINDSVN
jgi:beta-galactosidase